VQHYADTQLLHLLLLHKYTRIIRNWATLGLFFDMQMA